MAPKRATARREESNPSPLPEVLSSPSKVSPGQRDAYWLQLLDEPEQFKAAVQTEELWPMLKSFPEALWGDRLSIFIYRLPDDEGVMVKNAEGQAKYIKPVIRFCIDEDWVATKHGGGKYQLYLKLDDTVIRKHTFRIDGAPKVQPGQTVELDGKPVSVGQPAPPTIDNRSDLASVIEAQRGANDKGMEILTRAAEASITMVKEQAANAAKPDAASGIVDKLLTVMIDRMMNPPAAPDPIDTFVKLQTLMQKPNPEPEAQHNEGALTQGLELVERLTGKSMPDLMKPRSAAAETNDYGWVGPVVGAVTNFIDRIPQIMHEARLSRAMEFQRQAYLRNTTPGTPVPKELVEVNSPPEQPRAAAAPATPQPGSPPDPNQLVMLLVQTICHGFDTSPDYGHQTAATIDLLYGRQIEALGLEKYLAHEESLNEYIKGIPALAQRSQFATWAKFQEDFLDYTTERWGELEDEEPEKIAGPQPVA